MNQLISPFRILLWGLWSAGCISIAIIVTFITFNKKITVWLSKYLWATMAYKIPGVSLEVIENTSIDYSKPHVFIANHQSYLDIPCLMKASPSLLYFVAKQELKKIPFLGWYITLSGMILIDRSNRKRAIESLRNAGEMIKNGKSIVAFPEGTRTKTGEINDFKKGAFMLAIQAGVPIIPVALAGTGNVFPATKIQFIPGKAIAKICDPISTEGYNNKNVDELIAKTKQAIQTEYSSIRTLV